VFRSIVQHQHAVFHTADVQIMSFLGLARKPQRIPPEALSRNLKRRPLPHYHSRQPPIGSLLDDVIVDAVFASAVLPITYPDTCEARLIFFVSFERRLWRCDQSASEENAAES